MSKEKTPSTLLSAGNSRFLVELYAKYLEAPSSVDPSWATFFQEHGGEETPPVLKPSWAKEPFLDLEDEETEEKPKSHSTNATQTATDSIRAARLIRSYRVRGHLEANLDPLKLTQREPHPELHPKTYGFEDPKKQILLDGMLGLNQASLEEIYNLCRKVYCGNIGYEYMHIQNPEQRAWIIERVEKEETYNFSAEEKIKIFEHLNKADQFEAFLDTKYKGAKRFGLDGGESTVPALQYLIEESVGSGVREIIIGMAHRGRLNVLANIMGKRLESIFSEFQGVLSTIPDGVEASGDVKYHLGASADKEFSGENVHLSLCPNPSHLEAVDPIVLGRVRAKQFLHQDKERKKVMGILLHGDAAFAGQGLVPESLDLSHLKNYRSGGTIHIIINNQIGFTTNPTFSRSSPYCSDVAKMVQAPIFHVNGDDPEAVVFVAKLAAQYRQAFGCDVVIDLFCYRRHGHNEMDEPSFTQPLMYQKIKAQQKTRDFYLENLKKQGVLDDAKAKTIIDTYAQQLVTAFESSKDFQIQADFLQGNWEGIKISGEKSVKTGIEVDQLKALGKTITNTPEGFTLNSKITRFLENRAKAIESGEGLDWATAEALAFGSLLQENYSVRLSGQDSGRGTFTQRHARLFDQQNEKTYVPLHNLGEKQGHFEVIDSPLSELAVLGFEYGFSVTSPNTLVIWEAQFGDFANGAQIIIDQFVTSGEVKWLRMSGLVMLLPHGHEGQGPEHSSARLERYLQLSAEENIQVVNLTTPANYFHALRRQLHRVYRKPLIVMAPKFLLRFKLAVSSLEDFGPDSQFQPVIGDKEVTGSAKRLILCSGKVYYDLWQERENQGIKDIAIVRIEELYPFPHALLVDVLKNYTEAEVIWCQEEAQNNGAWHYIDRRIEKAMIEAGMKHTRPHYIGRKEAASPATGSLKRHEAEQQELVKKALMTDKKGD